MLHCRAGVFYTGHTDNLDRRVADHKAGRFEGFTKNRLPVELVWSQEFTTRNEAKSAENRIKGWSRAKKFALIRGGWGEISRLAKAKAKAKAKSSPSTGSGQAEILVAACALEAMERAARAAHPREACGLLLGEGARVSAFVETANVHATPASHFEIDPQALIDAHRAERVGGMQVLGYFHSHPVGEPAPSAADRASSAGDGRIWAIFGCDQIRFWRDDPAGFGALSYSVDAI